MQVKVKRLAGACVQLIPSETPGLEPITREIARLEEIEVDRETAELWLARQPLAWEAIDWTPRARDDVLAEDPSTRAAADAKAAKLAAAARQRAINKGLPLPEVDAVGEAGEAAGDAGGEAGEAAE